jgi:hypothetical protein
MSAGRIFYYNEGLGGVGKVYDRFPERLRSVVLEKNASLYNELYEMLNEEEKKNLNEGVFERDRVGINQNIYRLQKELDVLKKDPLYIDHLSNDTVNVFRDNRLTDVNKTVIQKEESLKESIRQRDVLEERLGLSKLFH